MQRKIEELKKYIIENWSLVSDTEKAMLKDIGVEG